jgi:hypothetical protein
MGMRRARAVRFVRFLRVTENENYHRGTQRNTEVGGGVERRGEETSEQQRRVALALSCRRMIGVRA